MTTTNNKNIWGTDILLSNPPVAVGTFFRYGLSRDDRFHGASVTTGVELVTDMSSRTAGRGWAGIQVPFTVLQRTGRVVVRGGITRGDNLPQVMMRLGGPQTVRGYPYGARVGKEFWSAQLDYALFARGVWTPVVFADVGDTFNNDPLVGVGAGVSLLNGMIRANVSKGVRPDGDLRFDLVFRAYR
jgi:outer membrane translocation and assembly module TamA